MAVAAVDCRLLTVDRASQCGRSARAFLFRLARLHIQKAPLSTVRDANFASRLIMLVVKLLESGIYY